MQGFSTSPKVTGPWHFGSDQSQNRIGLAETEQSGVLALGTADEKPFGTITVDQLAKLSNDVQSGRYNAILAE